MDNNTNTVPKHVAIIMDGNGRWAKNRGLNRIEGHYKGVDSVRTVIKTASDIGVKYLTLYAFSTENWARPHDEVDGIMELFCKVIAMEIPFMLEKNVKVLFIGDRSRLKTEVKESLNSCTQETKNCNGLTLVVALNYSARQELTFAVKTIAEKISKNEININDISEELISDSLFTKGIPDPDLLIRTSGECRISNFMMWQISYTELYFSDILWPDFDKECFVDAIKEYKKRSRRYGTTGN